MSQDHFPPPTPKWLLFRSWLIIGPPSSQSFRTERTLFGELCNMSRIFREISCGHCPWKLTTQICENFHQNFACLLQKYRQNFALRTCGHNQLIPTEFHWPQGSSAHSKHTRICTAPFEQIQRVVVPSEGVQIWVCLFLYGRSFPRHPHDRPDRGKHTQICTSSLGTTTLWTYSNGAVQIRVCVFLEHAEKYGRAKSSGPI